MPTDAPVPLNRDAERARNTARTWVGLTVLFAVLAALQWISNDDPWLPLGYTAAVLAYAGTAWQARQRARESAAGPDAGGAGLPV